MFQQFALLKDIPEDQINGVLALNDLYSNVDPINIIHLPKVDCNFINVCKFVDYYQLIDEDEFLENVRVAILNKMKDKDKDFIEEINELPLNMLQKIYNNECIPNIKCRYIDHCIYDIKHICCYRFLSQDKKIYNGIDKDSISYYGWDENEKNMYYGIDNAIENGSLDLIKYLFKIGKTCIYAIDLASQYGHLEIIRYFFEVAHQDCTDYAINSACKNGHLDVVKYLFEVQHKKCPKLVIYLACQSGHLDMVRYLFEVQHKNCTIKALNWASEWDYLDIVKYLIEIQNKKYTQETINVAQNRIKKYLLTKPNSFIKEKN